MQRIPIPFRLAQERFDGYAEEVYQNQWRDPAFWYTPQYAEILKEAADLRGLKLRPGQVVSSDLFAQNGNQGALIWDGQKFILPEFDYNSEGSLPFPITAPDLVGLNDHLQGNSALWWNNTAYRTQSLKNISYDSQDLLAYTVVRIARNHKGSGEIRLNFMPSLGMFETEAVEYLRSYLQSARYFLIDDQPEGTSERDIIGRYRSCQDCSVMMLFPANDREKYLREFMSERDLRNISTNMLYDSYFARDLFKIDLDPSGKVGRERTQLIQRREALRDGSIDPFELIREYGSDQFQALALRLQKNSTPELEPEIVSALIQTLIAQSYRD